MANSNFKVFAESAKDINLMADNEYSVDQQRINGVVPGLAAANLHNKLYKQVSIMSAALAQVLVEQGQNALDSDYNDLVAAIKKTFLLTLNGEKPDEHGNISKKFVFSVNGNKPDSKGNVTLNTDYLNAFSYVGMVLITKDNINPGSQLGGTWELLESGKYVRVAGESLVGGKTGGKNDITLRPENIPSHTHGATVYATDLSGRFRARSNTFYGHGTGSSTLGSNAADGRFSVVERGLRSEGNADDNNTEYICRFDGNHTHQTTINPFGQGEKVMIEPAYLSLYFWVRVA